MGVPMVMGEDTLATTAALEEKLVKLRPALWRTRPSYVLIVRVVLVFAISGAEYVYDVVLVGEKTLHKSQSLVDTILRDAIRRPQGFPKRVLRGSLLSMGLGGPNLLVRFAVRRVVVLLRALNSRSVYVRQAVRSRWGHPKLANQPYHDALRARADLRD